MNCTTLFAPLCFLPHSIRRRFFHAVYRYFLGETRYFRFLQEHDNDSEECSKLPEYLRRKELGQRVLIQSFPFFEGYIRSNVCVQSMRQLYEIECMVQLDSAQICGAWNEQSWRITAIFMGTVKFLMYRCACCRCIHWRSICAAWSLFTFYGTTESNDFTHSKISRSRGVSSSF